ncbi:MAG TPA: glycine--tRNA ligase [Mycoplasmatales bacterium]|nr:glycine--tRNA ligase [Mycoplasmatales bacterium]
MNEENLTNIYSFLKVNGFINQNAEIYGGFSKSWDLGINGSLLKNNIKELWMNFFVKSRSFNYLFDSPILTHEKILEASGHKKNFSDWIIFCKKCKSKFRIEQFLNDIENKHFFSLSDDKKEQFSISKVCKCGSAFTFNKPKKVNLMLETSINIEPKNEAENQTVFLRPETCQGIFINFKNLMRDIKKEPPFGIAQIGKSFRNEITLNHGIFRTREFEQAELEFFTYEEGKKEWWNYWINKSKIFFKKIIENENLISNIEIPNVELPHYSLKTLDLHFRYQFGWGEICSISDRGDYDLKNHSEKSSVFLGIRKENKKIYPNVIEISFGIERTMLAIFESSYKEENIRNKNSIRRYLSIHPLLSPYLVSVMPLSKQLKNKAKEIYLNLLKLNSFSVSYEETGNIGNRYRRQDSIGTKFCITIDFETEKKNEVTIRERDTMKQETLKIDEISNFLFNFITKERINFIE